MNSKLRFLGLCAFLVVLYVILVKVIVPFTLKIAKSDLYLDGSDDNGSLLPVNNDLSSLAYQHCNTYITQELHEDLTATFAPKPVNTWDIGSYTFVVNGEIDIQNQEGVSTPKKYVCRIKYDEGDQNDINNWSIYGISGLDGVM